MRPLLAWALYWTGDLAERLSLHDAYQLLMRWSDRAQGDGQGPWEPPLK